jgi:sialate O-acetylesterase
VTLPKILASHMVVQRELPVHVWGMAAPGEDVSVSFRGESRPTKASRLGRGTFTWRRGLPEALFR